jgi:hypothetical protein
MWFTSNAFWEPQAGHLGMGVDQVKLGLAEYQPSAQRKQPLSMEEMSEKGGGLVRLGMAQNKLVHQSQLDAAIGVPLILRLIAPIGADASAKRAIIDIFRICRRIATPEPYHANREVHCR